MKKHRVRIAALVLAAAILLALAAVSAAAAPKHQHDLGAVGNAVSGKQVAGTIIFSPASVVAGSSAFALTMTLSGTHAAVPTWTADWIGPTGSAALSVVSSTTASVVANVPADLVVTAGSASVAVSDGTNSWVGSDFVITPPGPTLTGIVPATATNSTASVPFTLSGANLLSAGSSSTVTLRTGTTIVTTAVVTSRTATAIDGMFDLASPTVPAGIYSVVLSGSGVTATLPGGFTVTGPTLTSITPSSGVNSNASLAFTLAGSGLSGLYSPIVTLRSGTVSVTATGLTAAPSGVSMTGSFNLASPVVPAGFYDVVLSYGSGASIGLTNAFTVANPGLVISSISPTTVYAGSVQPNLTLSVIGSGFVPAPATVGGVGSRVQIGSRVATDTVFVSATEIRTPLLPTDIAVAGTVSVRVVNPTPGGGTSSPVNLTVATDTAAPVTTISGADDAWHNSDVVLTVSATDSQSGLQTTQYTIGASAPAALSAGTITVPANGLYEGTNVVTAWSTDWCNHMENPGPSVTVKIDTVRPKAYGRNARGTLHGKKITLKFKIKDGLSDKAQSVWVRIVNPKHRIVQTRHFSRSVSMNEWYSFKWRAVSRGTYKYYVHGSDLAGNRSTTSAKKIIVK